MFPTAFLCSDCGVISGAWHHHPTSPAPRCPTMCGLDDTPPMALLIHVDDARAALVRAVLAQQWAVAITLVFWQPRSGRHSNTHENDLREGFDRAADALEELPCAVDAVAEMLGASCP